MGHQGNPNSHYDEEFLKESEIEFVRWREERILTYTDIKVPAWLSERQARMLRYFQEEGHEFAIPESSREADDLIARLDNTEEAQCRNFLESLTEEEEHRLLRFVEIMMSVPDRKR